jgi:hypothetical protein
MATSKAIAVAIEPQQIIRAVKAMRTRNRAEFLEDLLAATSPDYLASIRQARSEYRQKRTKTHVEVFGG